MSRHYEMFSDEGDDAVHEALMKIKALSKDARNRATLEKLAAPVLQEVAKVHGEIYDTEPRGHIADFLDKICEENGWTYDKWDSYIW